MVCALFFHTCHVSYHVILSCTLFLCSKSKKKKNEKNIKNELVILPSYYSSLKFPCPKNFTTYSMCHKLYLAISPPIL